MLQQFVPRDHRTFQPWVEMHYTAAWNLLEEAWSIGKHFAQPYHEFTPFIVHSKTPSEVGEFLRLDLSDDSIMDYPAIYIHVAFDRLWEWDPDLRPAWEQLAESFVTQVGLNTYATFYQVVEDFLHNSVDLAEAEARVAALGTYPELQDRSESHVSVLSQSSAMEAAAQYEEAGGEDY